MGGRKPQQPKKKKRHECDPALPPNVVAIAEEVLARCEQSDHSRVLGEGLRKLMTTDRVEEQTRIVHSWGGTLFTHAGVEASGAYADRDSVWHWVVRLMTSFLFTFSLAHLQKAVVGVFGGAAATAPNTIAYTNGTVFLELCQAWLDGHWAALRAVEGGEDAATAAVDSRAARARCALKVVCDVDCLLDHPKPVFHAGISGLFSPILTLLTRCTNVAALECLGVALLDGGDGAGAVGGTTGENATNPNAQGSGMEDLKYFARINLYLLQKFKADTRVLVAAAQARPAEVGGGVRELAKLCQQVLTHEGLFPKECLNTAGLMVAILLEAAAPRAEDDTPVVDLAASPHHAWMRDALELPANASGTAGEGATAVRSVARPAAARAGITSEALFDAITTRSSATFRSLLHSWSPYSQLLALRGVVHCCADSVYLARPAGGAAMLYVDFLPFATAFATNCDANMRFLSLQSLELAVRKIRDCIVAQGSAIKKQREADASVVIRQDAFLLTYDASLGRVLEAVLDVLWSVWDEPAAAIGHLLTSIFQLVLDVHRRGVQMHADAGWALDAAQQIDLDTIAQRLVDGPWLRRGKYPSLALMLPVVGAEKLRVLCPDIIPQTLGVLHLKALAHGAGALFSSYAMALKPLLSADAWDAEVLKPVAEALLFAGWDGTGATGTRATAEATADTHSGMLRHHLTNYALQPLMQDDPTVATRALNILTLTALPHFPELPATSTGEQPSKKRRMPDSSAAPGGVPAQARTVLPTLVARRLVASHVLITKLAKLPPQTYDVVRGALESHAPPVRIMSAQLMTLGSHRPSDLPTLDEIALLRAFTKRNLKTDDSAFRSHHSDLLRKWLTRCKESIHRYAKDIAGEADATAGAHKSLKKSKKDAKKMQQAKAAAAAAAVTGAPAEKHTVGSKRKGSPSDVPAPPPVPAPPVDAAAVAEDLRIRHAATVDYLVWLGRYLVRSAYSTSPLERRCVALELLAFIAQLFAPADCAGAPEAARAAYAKAHSAALPPAFVPVLMGSLCESWDKVRAATWNVLRLYPSPLPGYEDASAVERLARRAAVDMTSPKIKDADSGALVWRLLHRKYAVELGWQFTLNDAGDAVVREHTGAVPAAWTVHHVALGNLLRQLQLRVGSRRPGEFNPVHGVMAAIGNLLEDCSLPALVVRDQLGHGALAADVDGPAWRALLSAVVEHVCDVCKHAMRNVAGATTGEIDDFTPAGVDCRGHAFFADRNDEKSDRLVVVNSWLAVKEGCHLIGGLITTAPLAAPGSDCEVLPVAVIRHAGDVVIDIALRGKHNGVIAKASDALRMVCHRTIRCRLASLHTLPAQWLETLLGEGGVTSTNAARILRRSAGLPHVLTSILDAEDHNAGPPALAHSVIASLLEIIERPEADAAATAAPAAGGDDEPPAYLAKVNALNVLKYIVEDTFLRDVVLSYAGRSLALTLQGFSHDVWAVRNSSLMLFSALINRLVGSGSGSGATSFKDFLARYSSVLPTLLEHLRKASCDDKSGTGLHPALSPLLLLFSFLLPSGDADLAAAQARYFARGAVLAPGHGLVDERAFIEGDAVHGVGLEILGLLDACHGLKNCVGRTLSIRAFVPLIASTARTAAVTYIVSRLPIPGTGCVLRNNALHGRLLQLQGMLESGVSATSEGADVPAEVRAARAGVMPLLHACGTAAAKSIAPLNLALLFKVAAQLVTAADADAGFAEACRDAAWGVIHPFGVQAVPCGTVRGVVAGEEAYVRAVLLYLEAANALGDAAGGEACVVDGVLTHSLLESVAAGQVCAALAQGACGGHLLERKAVHLALLHAIQKGVAALLDTPTHASDIRYADNLRSMLSAAAVSCQRQPPGAVVATFATDAVISTLPQLLTRARKVVRNHHVASALLLFRATLASAQLTAAGAAARDFTTLAALAAELAETCSPHEAVEVRYGCVEALRLLNLPALYAACRDGEAGIAAAAAPLLVRLWRVACVLINDEHDGVREAMAAAVQDVPCVDGDVVRDPVDPQHNIAARLRAVPGLAHAERACEKCFEWLAASARLSVEGLAEGLLHLGSMVLHPVTPGQSAVFCEGFVIDSDAPPALPFAPLVVAGRSQVIFEVENHNHFSEDVLTVTLAVAQLRGLLAGAAREAATAAVADAFLARLARRVCIEATAVAAVLKESEESRALAFSSIFRLKLAALLCGARAATTFALIPPHYADSLWLAALDNSGTAAGMAEGQWDDLLFLHHGR